MAALSVIKAPWFVTGMPLAQGMSRFGDRPFSSIRAVRHRNAWAPPEGPGPPALAREAAGGAQAMTHKIGAVGRSAGTTSLPTQSDFRQASSLPLGSRNWKRRPAGKAREEARR